MIVRPGLVAMEGLFVSLGTSFTSAVSSGAPAPTHLKSVEGKDVPHPLDGRNKSPNSA